MDLAFACRWVLTRSPGVTSAVSVELLIHNRDNGATCFFAAKDPNPVADDDPVISTTIVSPTASNASSYWMQPAELNAKKLRNFDGTNTHANLRCVGCHVAGPYIASPNIAPFLAKFGLLNDGHDTFAIKYHAVLPPSPTIFGITWGLSSFLVWNSTIQANNSTSGLATCAAGCHSIGLNSTTETLFGISEFSIIPSLKDNIDSITPAGYMPADKPSNKDGGANYRWVNMDIPDGPGDEGESETLADLKINYQRFYCSNPVSLSARRVDSGVVISTSDFPDTFNRFNLQDGLVCLNADQPSGRCQNYQTRYHCNGRWTAWQDNDDPGSSGDWELRRGFKGICASPDGIQAGYKVGNKLIFAPGPIDRLAEFDNKGLVCINADQNNGQCSNYVVRFECP
ncbi:MAG TPA: hypothetical protein VHL14_02185 [Steroidobacteraceae bacterium]|nr:hypothetical protein [Steroidobacteraceae bacterium]